MTGYEIAKEQIEQFTEYQNCRCADYVVDISYSYDFEKEYIIRRNVLLSIIYDNGDEEWIWGDDWDEGQTDVIVNGIIAVPNIPREVFKTEKEKKKK